MTKLIHLCSCVCALYAFTLFRSKFKCFSIDFKWSAKVISPLIDSAL